MEFPDKIKLIRVLLGKTQLELAAELEIQQSAVTRYEKGGMHPRTALAFKYAAALNVSLDWLMNAGGKYHVGVYRPLSPWQTYSPASIKSINADLAGIESLARDIGATSLRYAEGDVGGILVAAQGSSTFAVIARLEILPVLRALRNCGLAWDEFDIPKNELLLALTDPSKICYKIFDLAGVNLPKDVGFQSFTRSAYPEPPPPVLKITIDVPYSEVPSKESIQELTENIDEILQKKHSLSVSCTWSLSSPRTYDPAFQLKVENYFSKEFLKTEGLLP